MDFPLLKAIPDIDGKRVLIRVDVNIPIEKGVAQDDFRIRRILPTIAFLQKKNVRIILLSHHSDDTQTLEPVAHQLNSFSKTTFVRDIFNTHAYSQKHTIYLCENLRFHTGEERNDEVFARKLASLGDIYVNESFSVSHRKHASIVTLPAYLPHYAGLLFEDEVNNLSLAFNPPRPFLFILGGMKSGTKLPLAEKFIKVADHVFVGGAVINTVFKQAGYETGRSIADEVKGDFTHLLRHEKVIIPLDVVVERNGKTSIKNPKDILKDEKMLDAGPETSEKLKQLIKEAAFVLWNGPLGDYEHGFAKSTIKLIEALSESNAKTLVGGGDTIAAISRFGSEDRFGFVSTGGGAMLEFLANRTLSGIEALKVNYESQIRN